MREMGKLILEAFGILVATFILVMIMSGEARVVFRQLKQESRLPSWSEQS